MCLLTCYLIHCISTRLEIACLIWIHQKPPAPIEFLRAFFKSAASRSRQVFVPLRIGRFPSDWKSADITPVHKKDLPEPAENYRPISLLPIVSKVMERCVCNRLYSRVSQSITSLQHGFAHFARALRNFCPYFIQSGRHLTKTNRQMFCTLILPRLSIQLTTPLLLES